MALASAALASVPPALADDAADHPAYWGSPSVEGGKCCARLAEVRANIDRIDKQIVALMAERGQYVAEAGRFKADPAAVSAPARVEAIIAKVKDSGAPGRPRRERRRTQLSGDDRRVRGLRARRMGAPQPRRRAGEVRGEAAAGFRGRQADKPWRALAVS